MVEPLVFSLVSAQEAHAAVTVSLGALAMPALEGGLLAGGVLAMALDIPHRPDRPGDWERVRLLCGFMSGPTFGLLLARSRLLLSPDVAARVEGALAHDAAHFAVVSIFVVAATAMVTNGFRRAWESERQHTSSGDVQGKA